MQSIKHHKWNHFNEEVSADYMPSRLEIDEMQGINVIHIFIHTFIIIVCFIIYQ